MECLAIDTIGDLPLARDRKQYIMVVSDYYSKWKEAFALENHIAQTVVDKLVAGVIYNLEIIPTKTLDSNRHCLLNCALSLGDDKISYHAISPSM